MWWPTERRTNSEIVGPGGGITHDSSTLYGVGNAQRGRPLGRKGRRKHAREGEGERTPAQNRNAERARFLGLFRISSVPVLPAAGGGLDGQQLQVACRVAYPRSIRLPPRAPQPPLMRGLRASREDANVLNFRGSTRKLVPSGSDRDPRRPRLPGYVL